MNFALVLFILLVVSGVLWLLDVLWLARRRRAAADRALADFDSRNLQLAPQYAAKASAERAALQARLTERPWYLEYTASFFPVILAVFVLRSFLFEPFRIPSGSMLPTLEVGDLILVNKYQYGIRLPVLHREIVALGKPARGDVIVFRFPHNPTQDYIKRVVGVPGDRVEYAGRRLSINGQPVPLAADGRYLDTARMQSLGQYVERVGAVEHRILLADGSGMAPMRGIRHTHPETCQYSQDRVVCAVPPGQYFVMGDNRDNSEDSRYWGFVPEDNIVGRAFFVWMSFQDWMPRVSRIGSFN